MASTLITTNADALKRAARELSKQSEGLTSNRILNILAGAIAGPGKNWGMITGAPSGHYLQPGLQPPVADHKTQWGLKIGNDAPMLFASREKALESFSTLATNARNRSDAEKALRTAGSATLRFRMIADVEVRLFEARSGQEVPPLGDQPLSSSVVPYSNESIARLKKLVSQRRRILITGACGIGKTVLLNKLAEAIPEFDGLVRIDPHDELHFVAPTDEWRLTGGFQGIPGVLGPLLADSGVHADLWEALRVPHSWIVLSELPMHSQSINLFLQAGMTGHLTLSTMQANSINDALVALECGLKQEPDVAPDLAKAFVSGGIDVVVHLSDPGPKHARYIEVAEVRDRERTASGPDAGDYDIVALPL